MGRFTSLPHKVDGGFVIHDHTGELVATGARRLENMRDALQAEADAMQYAIQAVTSLGMDQLIF